MVKYARVFFLVFVLALLAYTPSDAAWKSKRGVQVASRSAPSLDRLYNQSYAVIIGINSYEKWPSLEYAVKDAKAMEERLKTLGFQTTVLLNQHATKDRILKVLGDDLPKKVQKNDRVLIFFAGHGQTEELADGSQMGYIVPVDADTRDIFSTAISMDQVRVFSRRLAAKHVLYLIDSCYAGLGLTRSGTIPPSERDYLRKITTRKAHQMLTAGGKGEQAHEEGGHGVFTKYVLEALEGAADRDEKGFITFSDIASYVKPKVSRYTGAKQVPQYGSIDGEGEFVFVLAGLTPNAVVDSSGLDTERQRLVEQQKRLAAEEERLRAEKAELERQKQEAKRETERTTLAMGAPPFPPPTGMQTFTSPTLGAKFVLIPAGTFMMGSPENEPGRGDKETQHQVTISRAFYMQTTEVTQGQWKRVMGNNPSKFQNCGDDCPVEQVSWNDVQEFIRRLNRMEGTDKYRLPTEAQWEYAARSGSKQEVYAGTNSASHLGEYAWYDANSGKKTHPVGQKRPNTFGLYDMSGNVWEFVKDRYLDYPSGSVTDPEGLPSGAPAHRGGSWLHGIKFCRSAARACDYPGYRSLATGFRLVRSE